MADIKNFGEHIRKLREDKAASDPNFTLRKFAKAVGVSPAFLSKMERGEYAPPSAEKISKMAELLGCSADKLLALADKMAPDLKNIITSQPDFVPDLLRAFKRMSSEELSELKQSLGNRKGKE